MKHYNGATVWGSIHKKAWEKTETGKDYIELLIDCPNDVLGPVRVLGRVWNSDLGEVLEKRFQKGQDIRLEGNIQQYQGRNEVTRTTFNFFRIIPGQLKEKKAAFRLVGEVVSLQGNLLKLSVKQEANDYYPEKEEVFEVFVPDDVLLSASEPFPGAVVRLKGYIQAEEDEFGESKGPQRPVVKQLEIVEEG